MEKTKENILPKIKVGLPELCRELNRLTGGSSTDFTGYYCSIYPKCEMFQPWNKDAFESGERNAEKVLRNCELKYTLLIHRACIVPEKFRKVENDYPCFAFENLSVKLKDRLPDGSHVYEHVLMGQGQDRFCVSEPSNGVESIGRPGARFLVLDNKINPCLLDIELSMKEVESQRATDAKTTLVKAIASLSKSKLTGKSCDKSSQKTEGGKV